MEHYGESEENNDPLLEARTEELAKTKEQIKTAKDRAMQSWLDSRPTIDKLERLQSRLASAKNRSSMSNIVVAELESELEATIASFNTKKEEELKATKRIDETTQAINQTREEIKTTKHSTDEERRARSNLKQVLRLKKQSLRTLQLTLRAVRMESEAYQASAEKALHHINCAETDSISLQLAREAEEDSPVKALQQTDKAGDENNTVHLSLEDYHALQRKAKDEASLAKWRVSVSLEQKLAAEESRDLASARLQHVKTGTRSSSTRIEEMMAGGEDPDESIEVEEAQVRRRSTAIPKTPKPRNEQRNNYKTDLRGGRSKNRRVAKKKKPYILRQISFLLLGIRKWFR